jgi:hypothetical protein
MTKKGEYWGNSKKFVKKIHKKDIKINQFYRSEICNPE